MRLANLLYRFIKYALFSLLVCISMGLAERSYAQETARYSRFQYHKYKWRAYHGKRFNIYFPATAADSLYRFLVTETPDIIERIKKATIKDVPQNINIIAYPSLDQLYETNIGGYEPAAFTFPTFVYKGTRIVLAYNGSYADLRDQLSEGLARSLWESQMKGDGGGQSKESSSQKTGRSKKDDIPFWYKEGYIRYAAFGWRIADEDKLRQSLQQNNFTSWQQVFSYEPRLAGHAFCYFLTQNYYPTVVAQSLFQLQKKKSLTRALRLVTKRPLDTLIKQCFSYYKSRFIPSYTNAVPATTTITIPWKKGIIGNIILNPTKDLIAYTSLASGRRSVYIYNILDRSTYKIATYKMPPWIDEHSSDQYPLLAWHPDGKQIYIAKPGKGKVRIRRYSPLGKYLEGITLDGVDGITHLQPLSEREFLLSAYRRGQSDVVSYNENKVSYTPYTDDEYDDGKAVLTNTAGEVIFTSNRPKKLEVRKTYVIGVGYKKDTLYQGIYRLNSGALTPELIDSNTYIKWDDPLLLKDKRLLVTSTKHGTKQFFVFNYISKSLTPLAQFQPYQYLANSDEISFSKSGTDSIYTSVQPMAEWLEKSSTKYVDTTSPWLNDRNAILAAQAKEDSILNKGKDTAHYFMDDIFAPKRDTIKNKKTRRKERFTNTSPVGPYVLQLHSAYFTAKVNNDYFINRYQPFLAYQGSYKFPEIGGMTKGGFTDLLENHHFTIAYCLPAATNGSTFYMHYENTEKQLDWGFSYFRKVETLKPDANRNWVDESGNKYPDNAKTKTHYYEFLLRRSLTYYSYASLQTAIRHDRTVFLATDKYTLNFAPVLSTWSITTLTYHINKLTPTIPYLYKGFTVNTNIDLFKGFTQKQAFLVGSTINAAWHQPLYKYITLITQLHAGYSGGDQQVLYNLGGEDNNVTPRADTTVHFAKTAPYAFQILVTPFRGYYQNSLYGNKYLLLNADLYFPIFQTLIPIGTPLPFINNIQLGLLADAATAQESTNDSNPNNHKWLTSYGLSARSVLAGYPLKLDVAWPGTFSKQPVWYFSLSL